MPHPTLLVTLLRSNNEYLKYPCRGLLELFEIGTHGGILSGVFRCEKPSGGFGAPVEVREPIFSYCPPQ